MVLASVVCLTLIALLCVVGTLHPRYDDNLLQRCGMALLALACIGRAAEALASGAVSAQSMIMHVAVLLCAVGTAFKYWRRT